MSETVTPALTPEEWAAREISAHWWSLGIGHRGKIGFGATDAGGDMTTQQRHGVAALCLFGQPFGFTHEDVELLKRCADGCDGSSGDDDDDRVFPDGIEMRVKDVRRLRSLASRITALLPPKHFPSTP